MNAKDRGNGHAFEIWHSLIGAPPLRILENKDDILRKGEKIVEDIFKLSEDQEVLVRGNDLREYFYFQYNPQKRETPKGELERWLNFIDEVSNIKSHYDFHRDAYYFKKVKPDDR